MSVCAFTVPRPRVSNIRFERPAFLVGHRVESAGRRRSTGALERTTAVGQEHLSGELLALSQRVNRSADEILVVPSAYLEVAAASRVRS
jgi:hypothetical protein